MKGRMQKGKRGMMMMGEEEKEEECDGLKCASHCGNRLHSLHARAEMKALRSASLIRFLFLSSRATRVECFCLE